MITYKIMLFIGATSLINPHEAFAAPTKQIKSSKCTNPINTPVFDQAIPSIPINVPTWLYSKISYYVDPNGLGGTFAPAGWACEVHSQPDSYAIETIPTINDQQTREVPIWQKPLVDEQIFSADGGVPGTVSFYALAASVFPEYFPGGLDKWVGRPLRAIGSSVTNEIIKSLVPIGRYDRITYKNSRIAEFITPANKNGLGTLNVAGGPNTSTYATYGVIGIGPLANGRPIKAEVFIFRLPPELNYLREPLIKLVENKIRSDL